MRFYLQQQSHKNDVFYLLTLRLINIRKGEKWSQDMLNS